MSLTARRVVIRHRNPCIWRTYSTETTHESESRRSPFPSRRRSFDSDTDERVKIPRVSVAQRTIHVRAWEHPESMADAFAIVRGVERKYGRIRDFMWVRDWEMPQTYQSILWAAFYSSESFDRVPKMGETIHIPAPDVDSIKEGGLGFRELQGLLKASDRVDDEFEAPVPDIMQRVIESGDPKKSESRPRMLDVKVERALNETIFYPSFQIIPYGSKKRSALGHALLDWGGFAPIKPMFGSQSPYNSDQEDVPVDNEGMRKVLNMAAQLTSRPDPSFETAEVPEVTKVEDTEKKRERGHVQSVPARTHSRSWSLPPPPPDSQKTTSPKHAKTGRPANATKAPAGTTTARQQQILAKAKATKKPAADKSKSAQTTSKKVKEPEVSLKNRIWDVVSKWF